MPESDLVPIEEDEELGLRVLKLRLQGLTATQIGRELMIAVHQVHKALDAVLPTVDANYRRRAIAESLVTIDTVIAEHMKTIADAESASIVIRGVCERRALLGVTGSSDPIQLSMQPTTPLSSTDRIRAALESLCAQRRNCRKVTATPNRLDGKPVRNSPVLPWKVQPFFTPLSVRQDT